MVFNKPRVLQEENILMSQGSDTSPGNGWLRANALKPLKIVNNGFSCQVSRTDDSRVIHQGDLEGLTPYREDHQIGNSRQLA